MAYGNIIDIFRQLEYLGFFDIILPFLLIFAVVFGILSYMKIFGDQKSVHVIIAIVIGLLSIRLPFFSAFLTQISPRLGVGLVILLTIIILIGLFTPEESRGTISWILLAVGAIIFIVIIVQTANVMSYFGTGYYFSEEIIGWVVMIAILIGVVVAVVAGNSSGSKKGPAPLWQAVTGK